jgi:uncharacterized protein YjbI with pentapeptide repeats
MSNDDREKTNGRGDAPPGARRRARTNDSSSSVRLDYRGADLQRQQFVNMELEHYDFRGAKLQDANFTGSNLRYADFRGAEIHRTNFQHTSLYGAKLQGAEAFGADFRHADLRQANLLGAYTEGAFFQRQSPGDLAAGEFRREKSWKQHELGNVPKDGNASNDENERDRQRSLATEQRQQRRGQRP